MSDIFSPQPVRTGLVGQAVYEDLIVKIADGTTSSQLLGVDASGRVTIKLQDGAGTAITSQLNGSQQALDVGINVAGVQIDPRQIRALTSADVVTVDQGTSPWVTKDQADGPVTPGTVASFSELVGGQYNTSLPTLTAAQQAAMQLTAKGELITIQDVGGAPVSATNPLPVQFSSTPLGTPINDYNTATAVAAAASSNHDYSITALKTFQGKKIWASAPGLMKIEVQISPDGSAFTSKWVGFNSPSNPNITIDMDEMVFLESGTGAKIRVIRTNLDNKAQNLYSTISGTEV